MADGTADPRRGRLGSKGRRWRRPVGRSAIIALAGAGLLAALAPAAGATDSPAAPHRVAAAGGERTADGAALDAVVRAMVREGGAAATLARVRENGSTVWKGAAGVADLATGAPADPDGRFRIGSVTKTFVATVVLQLVAEHRIGLDDSVESRLPGVVPNGAGITVRQLLNHTSGIHDFTEDPAFDASNEETLRQWLAGGRWTSYRPQQLVDIADKYPPYFAPGQGWHYSNTDYVLISMIIERLTGRSWAQEVDRRIIRPLGLTGTSMPLYSPFIPGSHAHGYYKLPAGPADVTLLNPSMASAAGAGISTTADLTRFIAALLGGQLLGPAELAAMKDTSGPNAAAGYGLGLQRLTTPCGEFWGHDGGIPGYNTLLVGEVTGKRQFATSINRYDLSDHAAMLRTSNALYSAGTCGGGPSASSPSALPSDAAATPYSAGPLA
ncbi:serine hydrolase domain-containing protein [Kitasatospora sp. NPDC001261]|uniref:serine hydrolase domain-containing protein n=1 Tax=Kitasatospora sp. NPDC001261 TaxID=3364012 RepID=UPI0036C43869